MVDNKVLAFIDRNIKFFDDAVIMKEVEKFSRQEITMAMDVLYGNGIKKNYMSMDTTTLIREIRGMVQLLGKDDNQSHLEVKMEKDILDSLNEMKKETKKINEKLNDVLLDNSVLKKRVSEMRKMLDGVDRRGAYRHWNQRMQSRKPHGKAKERKIDKSFMAECLETKRRLSETAIPGCPSGADVHREKPKRSKNAPTYVSTGQMAEVLSNFDAIHRCQLH